LINRGYIFVFCCACSFGLIPTLAKITYDEGAPLEILVFFRIFAGSLFMGVWSGWSYRKNFFSVLTRSFSSINKPIGFLIFLIGIFVAGMSLGYLGSYQYIPVSLSVLIFFTFPFWVLIINFMIDGISVKPIKIFAFILAFFGLSVCLGPNWNLLDMRGISLALIGSLCSAGMIVGASKATKIISMPDLIFFSNIVGAIIVGLILFFTGSFSLSYSLGSWLGIFTICILFTIGQLSLFAATKNIGASQTSVMLNIEPIVTIVTAILLLGESLILTQIFGVTVILISLFMASFELRTFKIFTNKNKNIFEKYFY